jgi:hypothetical protein
MEIMMNTFVNAVINQDSRTQNGMKARASTASACVDLFFKIGALRGQDPIPAFTAAFVEDAEIATRIALWARDARNGAGEREIYRKVLRHAAKNLMGHELTRLIDKTPELGRWDDLLVLLEDDVDEDIQNVVASKIGRALMANDGLCAKWTPRKGAMAVKLRNKLGMSPKQYRKTLVTASKVVETQMCAKNWDEINFSHVPSVAASRYKKAFNRHTPKYKEWVDKLVKGDKTVKVNAGAVYPYDVLKGVSNYAWRSDYNKTELDVVKAQWDALPNYVGDANVLALVDVSGSMGAGVAGGKTTAMDVAVSLGLYCADKNKGKFKDTFLTFSSSPQLLHLKGDILQKVQQMVTSKWEMNTNLHAAFEKILDVAIKGDVPQSEMPATLLIMSDMQFDQCTRFDDTAMQMIRRKYETAGYTVPNIVFWNIMAASNVPVKFNERGVALVSGFSPSILKSVLSGDMEDMTPTGVMMKTIMHERYA